MKIIKYKENIYIHSQIIEILKQSEFEKFDINLIFGGLVHKFWIGKNVNEKCLFTLKLLNS